MCRYREQDFWSAQSGMWPQWWLGLPYSTKGRSNLLLALNDRDGSCWHQGTISMQLYPRLHSHPHHIFKTPGELSRVPGPWLVRPGVRHHEGSAARVTPWGGSQVCRGLLEEQMGHKTYTCVRLQNWLTMVSQTRWKHAEASTPEDKDSSPRSVAHCSIPPVHIRRATAMGRMHKDPRQKPKILW